MFIIAWISEANYQAISNLTRAEEIRFYYYIYYKRPLLVSPNWSNYIIILFYEYENINEYDEKTCSL